MCRLPCVPGVKLRVEGVEEGPVSGGVQEVLLLTDSGNIDCRFHPTPTGDAAALFVFGAGGGLGGPAGGLYIRLATYLANYTVASLRLDYRHPGRLDDCVLDVLAGVGYLEQRGRKRIALAGHSFGGAVVIRAGAVSDAVVGVAALSSQGHGTESVADLSPRPLLLVHGDHDEVLPVSTSREIYSRAKDPRQLLIYDCGHGLDDCGDEVERDLLEWLRNLLVRLPSVG